MYLILVDEYILVMMTCWIKKLSANDYYECLS